MSSSSSLLLGFKDDVVLGGGSGYKLVPWVSWEEWDRVRMSLFSSSPSSISSALNRVVAWRSRGCLPVVIDVTASLIEIQQKDPYFRVDIVPKGALESEEILAMLYCMAIMRLVNGVVEKTRKKTEISIGEAADTINIPRVLIDIRHECSHRDLPSLRLVRLASVKALDWLKSYYWEPQKKAIQFQSNGASRIKNEINSKLCELAFLLKTKQLTVSSSPIKSKRSKKKIDKAMKNLLRMYASYSLEVGSIVVELLLKESSSSDFLCLDDDSLNDTKSVFDDWKPAIMKLSNKEPDFLLSLIKAVHERIETQEAMIYGSGELPILEDTALENHVDRLSDLFAWLVIILKGLKPVSKKGSPAVQETYSADTSLPMSTLVDLLRRALLVSSPGNSQLKCSTLVLANMVGNNSLVEKLNKLFLLSASNPEIGEENSSIMSSETIFSQQEDSINQAAKNLMHLRLRKRKSNATDGTEVTKDERRWVVVKKWNKCPIGMLPLSSASSGVLPVLNQDVDHNKVSDSSENKERSSLVERNLKRKPDCHGEFLNEFSGKKLREDEMTNCKDDEVDLFTTGLQGKLMIGGVWKKVEEQELSAIAADVKVLV